MPSKSKSQRKLFGKVRAYQEGEMTDASPEKRAYSPVIPPVVRPIKPKENFWDKQHEKLMPKEAEKTKEAFDRGFVKAAVSSGFDILDAIVLLQKV